MFRSVKDAKNLACFGGDVLFLLRNIAVTATGEARELATSCFQQVILILQNSALLIILVIVLSSLLMGWQLLDL